MHRSLCHNSTFTHLFTDINIIKTQLKFDIVSILKRLQLHNIYRSLTTVNVYLFYTEYKNYNKSEREEPTLYDSVWARLGRQTSIQRIEFASRQEALDREHDESLQGAFWVKSRARFLGSSLNAQISQVTHATFNHLDII